VRLKNGNRYTASSVSCSNAGEPWISRNDAGKVFKIGAAIFLFRGFRATPMGWDCRVSEPWFVSQHALDLACILKDLDKSLLAA
jgi:hypothetical protein